MKQWCKMVVENTRVKERPRSHSVKAVWYLGSPKAQQTVICYADCLFSFCCINELCIFFQNKRIKGPFPPSFNLFATDLILYRKQANNKKPNHPKLPYLCLVKVHTVSIGDERSPLPCPRSESTPLTPLCTDACLTSSRKTFGDGESHPCWMSLSRMPAVLFLGGVSILYFLFFVWGAAVPYICSSLLDVCLDMESVTFSFCPLQFLSHSLFSLEPSWFTILISPTHIFSDAQSPKL